MVSLWNILGLFCIYLVMSVQYPFYGASPLHGKSVYLVPFERFPFVVSLNNRTELQMCRSSAYNYATELSHKCGGSLITTEHILTAAHCIARYTSFNEVVVKIGSINLRNDDEGHEVSWWVTFSQYSGIQLFDSSGNDIKDDIYDIAIMKLKKPVREDFPLPTLSYIPSEKLYSKVAVMAGWGRIKKNKKPKIMRTGKAIIRRPEDCSAYQPNELKDEWKKIFLCSDISLAQVEAGDSGGPLLYGGVDRDYPNNIIAVVKGVVERSRAERIMDEHISINFFKEFIESVTNTTLQV